MALIYGDAKLAPSKLELVSRWLPGRPWSPARQPVELGSLGSYRFDDPAGEVGVETFLVRAPDGSVVQVPLTYRGAPLPDAEEHLVGTMEHSVLGTRWVYDGCGDPVWAAALLRAVWAAEPQAVETVQVDGRRTTRDPAVPVTGGGAPGRPVPHVDRLDGRTDTATSTVVHAGGFRLVLVRRPGAEEPAGDRLTGRIGGGDPVLLAAATLTES